MDINPYKSPAITPPPGPVRVAEGVCIDGRCLVVRSGAALPPICVATGRPVSLKHVRTRQLLWPRPLVEVLALLTGSRYRRIRAARRTCELTYAVNPNLKLAPFSLIILFIFLPLGNLVAMLAARSMPMAAVGAGTLALALWILWKIIPNSLLVVEKCRDGEFWIGGCSKDFLAELRARAGV